MIEARVGRLLGACLHQAISDELPQRLDFYEHWLKGQSLRDGSVGLAPLSAVLGFLRTEGDAYAGVTMRAGKLAGEWTVASMSPFERRLIQSLPRALRTRAAVRAASRLVREVYSESRVTSRVGRGSVTVDVAGSVFCAVREPQHRPLCGFYAAAVVETLNGLGVPAMGQPENCRAVKGSKCSMTIELGQASRKNLSRGDAEGAESAEHAIP
jgi:hypothetical protein